MYRQFFARQCLEIIKEFWFALLECRRRLEVLDITLCELEGLYVLQTFIQATKDSIFSPRKWIFAKEQLKNCQVVVLSDLPMRVRHCDLVRIRQ